MLTLKIQGWPPSVHKAWGSKKFGRGRYKTAEYLKFDAYVRFCEREGELDLSHECLSVEVDLIGNWKTLKGTLRVQDCENNLKCCLDSVCTKLGFDDSRFVSVNARKIQSSKVRMTIVRIKHAALHEWAG